MTSLITGGCTIGTSAIYEYAATIIAPMYFDPNCVATNIEVGPSAAPMIAIDAASLMSKPSSDAILSVKKIPNCAAAPKNISFGLVSSGPKSIIAPMPMNKSSGNSSFAIPDSKSRSIVSTAPEKGRFASIAPKPIGNSNAGSISFLIARYISAAPIIHMTTKSGRISRTFPNNSTIIPFLSYFTSSYYTPFYKI